MTDWSSLSSPFKHVYTGIDKTVKQALPLKSSSNWKSWTWSLNPRLELARDMFLFSFYTRGMSFIDMAQHTKQSAWQYAHLPPSEDLTKLHIKWEPAMQEIVARSTKQMILPYLLPMTARRGSHILETVQECL